MTVGVSRDRGISEAGESPALSMFVYAVAGNGIMLTAETMPQWWLLDEKS